MKKIVKTQDTEKPNRLKLDELVDVFLIEDIPFEKALELFDCDPYDITHLKLSEYAKEHEMDEEDITEQFIIEQLLVETLYSTEQLMIAYLKMVQEDENLRKIYLTNN